MEPDHSSNLKRSQNGEMSLELQNNIRKQLKFENCSEMTQSLNNPTLNQNNINPTINQQQINSQQKEQQQQYSNSNHSQVQNNTDQLINNTSQVKTIQEGSEPMEDKDDLSNEYLEEEEQDSINFSQVGQNFNPNDPLAQAGVRPVSKRARQDNSLGVLTKQFVKLIKEANEMTIDLNETVKELRVQKRRIYDITNVLEGIGYIEKIYKNKIKWVGGHEMDLQFNEEMQQQKLKYHDLCQEEKDLDKQLVTMQEILNKYTTEEETDHAFLTYDDIKNLGKISQEQNDTFMMIKALKGASLEIPDQEDARHAQDAELPFQIILNTNGNGIIQPYMISDVNEQQINFNCQSSAQIGNQSNNAATNNTTNTTNYNNNNNNNDQLQIQLRINQKQEEVDDVKNSDNAKDQNNLNATQIQSQ